MHTEHPHPAPGFEPKNPEIRYEKSDAHVRPLYHFLFWISVVALFTAAFSWAVWKWGHAYYESGTSRAVMAPPADAQPAGPRLQLREAVDLKTFQAEEAKVLSTYGVVDREKGLYRIPIEEAMKLTLQRGLPSSAATPAPVASPAAVTPGTSPR